MSCCAYARVWRGLVPTFPKIVRAYFRFPCKWSGKALSGEIAGFGRLRQLILGIADRLNACEYMGFDIGITDRGFRLMEINSHPEIRGFQCFRPMFATPEIADYFKRKLAALDALSPERRKARNGILR